MTYPPKDYYKGIDRPGPLRCTIERTEDADGTCRPVITELKPMNWLEVLGYRIRRWFDQRRKLPETRYTLDDLDKLEYAIDVDASILTRLIDPALLEHEQIKLVLTPTEHVISTTTRNHLKDKDPRV